MDLDQDVQTRAVSSLAVIPTRADGRRHRLEGTRIERFQSAALLGALIIVPGVVVGAILWKTLGENDDEGIPAAPVPEVGDGEVGSPEEAPAVGLPKRGPDREDVAKPSVLPEAELTRPIAKRLIQECEGGRTSSCDELTAACMRIIPEAPTKGIAKAPGANVWRRIMPTKAHGERAMDAGCQQYFHGMACHAGSDAHCLSAGSRKALAEGCQRGCGACCNKATETAAPESDPGKARACDEGDAGACLELAQRLRLRGPDGEKQARRHAEAGCRISPHACDEYARYVGLGLGGERDERKALDLLERSRAAPESSPCRSSGLSACRPISGLGYLELLTTIAPGLAEERCNQGDWRACTGRMLPAPDDYGRTLATMNAAAARVYPACPDIMAQCPVAVAQCEQGDVRACLSVVGRVHSAQVSEVRLAFERLKAACAAGTAAACVE